jgi:type II secretory pathway component PulC
MKIGTIRSLLFVLDIALVAAIGWVVTLGLKAREHRPEERRAFEQSIQRQLQSQKAAPAVVKRAEYAPHILNMNLSGKEKEAPPPPVEAPKAAVVKTPLKDLLKIVGIQCGPGNPPSLVYLVRAGQGAAGVNPQDLLKDVLIYTVDQVVEWAGGAVIKRVYPDRVIFDYDNQEVTIEYPPPPPLAGAPPGTPGQPGGAPGASGPAPVPNDNPKTWVTPFTEGKPIEVTSVGMVSMAQKGEAVIEGVRWSTERLKDGKAAVRLDHIPEGNVLREGGAMEGDVLESINGIRMTSKGDVIDYVRRSPSVTRFEVKFWRQGLLRTRIITAQRR